MNLIRMVAAIAVLVSHAWPMTRGPGTAEPLSGPFGLTLGTLAVHVFFALSGFLVMASFQRAPDWRTFVMARALRLFPGLAVSLLIVAFILGPLVTAMSLPAYLADGRTLGFVLHNLTLVQPAYQLPGVFDSNPYPAVEGSLWTLFHEVVCYLLVLAIGLSGAFGRPRLMAGIFAVLAAVIIAGALADAQLHPKLRAFDNLVQPFLLGGVFYLLRDRIPLTLPTALALVALAAAARPTPLWHPLLTLALVYGTFWLAFVPGGAVRRYNRLGDYSYGLYVYAFPVQGLVVWLLGSQTPLQNVALALPLTLVLAVLSWHLVEAPALKLRSRRRDAPESGSSSLRADA